jgi:hypothetical protein
LLPSFLSGRNEQGDPVNTHKTTTPVGGGPVLSRCVSCGKVLSESSGAESMCRESAATLAMSSAQQECSACRLSEYRRSLKDSYSRW